MRRNNIEVLAPAGSFETMQAVIAAGADAVYLGGSRFGARAYAKNFESEELLRALDYVHLRGKKLYLTVNTLLRDEEIDNLYDYLLPFYQNGLDAVIVQDLGVLRTVRECFRDLPIHASTQMSICSPQGAALLKERGASRIVTARELSLEEIQNIHRKVDIEIESFVHGALCYSYSGQCLFSSMLGGRSGNRGRCAQPCRLGYQVREQKNGKMGKIKNPNQPYVLSLKDIQTLQILPHILEAGVESLKIEGRMKKTEYAVAVVEAYRKYVDLYLEKGKEAYKCEEKDICKLMDIYNRGGFTSGYYQQRNGKNMVSLHKPNHVGVKVSQKIQIKKNQMSFVTCTPLNENDVLQIESKQTGGTPLQFTVKNPVKQGQIFTVPIPVHPDKWDIEYGVYRIRNNKIIGELEEKYTKDYEKIRIQGDFFVEPNQPVTLMLQCGEKSVCYTGAVAQQAQNQSTKAEEITKQLKKMGNTPFLLESLQVHITGEPFIGKKELNACRRMGLQALEDKLLEEYKREDAALSSLLIQQKEKKKGIQEEQGRWESRKAKIYCAVSTISQLEVVSENPVIQRIYIESTLLQNEKIKNFRKNSGAEWYVTFPHVIRMDTYQKLAGWKKLMEELKLQGCLVRSVDGLAVAKQMGFSNIVSDYSLYTMNRFAKEELEDSGITEWVSSVECNRAQLQNAEKHNGIIGVYGYQPLMISANCVYKTCEGCKQSDAAYFLYDRYQAKFFVHRDCVFCYNIIYNSKPLFLLQEWEELKKMGYQCMQVHFTVETKKNTQDILHLLEGIVLENKIPHVNMEEYTRGHWKRGVE